jgi:tryptophan-rich sensory protein
MFSGILMMVLCLLLCSAGAYFVANAICQRCWKEKIPQSKLIGFAAIFVFVFLTLAILMMMASELVFGR